ncbi:uncharacterized protein LOC127718820 isoform X2 [Mytilus californianus]|uniref:uncharacterized protein LOC127718820 isoform X2 n=1 Tax=Mytilus californianus TaxID=6549 RepID=UPI0022458ED6|nr:uncharacterized protein LOC127718820 isoform X2 [Mytilus californianus]
MADVIATSASEAGCLKDGVKTVVIAFDGSDNAKHAMKFYADTVHTPKDNVIVVYCVELGEVITTGTVQYIPIFLWTKKHLRS